MIIVLSVVALAILITIVLFILSRSKGKISINLDKMEYSPGETITGKVVLNLKKTVQAKALNIGLMGEKSNVKYGGNRNNRTQRTSGKIFDFSKPLAGEGNYPVGEKIVEFQLKIPQDILTQSSMGTGAIGSLVKSAQILTGNISSVKWYVTAWLDISGIDISKKIQINIG